MTIKIEIEAHPDRGDMGGQIERAMSALGFMRKKTENKAAAEAADKDLHDKMDAQTVTDGAAASGSIFTPDPAVAVSNTATRKRGEPSPGKARRTKAEIAEDEAADQADASAANYQADMNANLAAISTGAERVGPEDSEADAQQDAADEAAEAAAKSDGSVTHDDLRKAVGEVQKKFGMPAAVRLVQEGGVIGKPIVEVSAEELPAVIAAVLSIVASDTKQTDDKPAAETKPVKATATRADVQAAMVDYMKMYGEEATQKDGVKIFKSALGEVPEGTKNGKGVVVTDWALSAIPDDPEKFAACVSMWQAALRQAPNAFGRKAVS